MSRTGLAPDVMTEKQRQFNAAMARYTAGRGYQLFTLAVSLANVGLQGWLLWRLRHHAVGAGSQLLALAGAWLTADFINGLVHLYMDDNDRYEGFAGPLVANFHLHHKTPLYTKRSLPLVYFVESGSKVWLVPCLALLAFVEGTAGIDPLLFHALVYVGILSSLAEVSHYLCHTSTSPLSLFLSRFGLVLSKRRHARHHTADNVGYTFQNGLTDPLVDRIAGRFYPGYKQTTDQHYAGYVMEAADGR